MPGFSIVIDGKITEVKRSLTELEGDLKSFKSQLGRSVDTREVVRLNQEIKLTESYIKKIRGLSLGDGITRSANGATLALTDLSRIANDVPFGLMGIANNVSPMVESFGRLKTETGSAKGALAAMASSLIGPAGLGLALNLVTSAFIIYQNGISGFNRRTKEAKDKADDFVNTLKSVAQVTAESAAQEEGSIAKIRSLAAVIAEQTNSYEQRNRALDELKNINKSYFGDLTLEEDKLAALTGKVNEYIEAIKAQAVVKGFESEIGRVSVELAKQDLQLKKLVSSLEVAKSTLAETPETTTSATGEERITSAYVKQQKAVREVEKAMVEQRAVVETLATNYAELNGAIDAAVKTTLQYQSTGKTGSTSQSDALKKQLEFYERIASTVKDVNDAVSIGEIILDLKTKILLRDASKEDLSSKDIESALQSYREQFQELLDKQAISLEAKADLKMSNLVKVEIPSNVNFFITDSGTIATKLNDEVAKALGVNEKMPVITLHEARVRVLGSAVTTKVEQKEALQKSITDAVNEAIVNLKIEALSSLGEMVGAALMGGMDGLREAAQSALSTIGGIISQLGKRIIAAVIKIKALKEVIEEWAIANPGLAIAAGIALVALGATLKNVTLTGSVKMGSGGITTGPTLATIGEAGREVVMPLSKLPQIISSMGGSGGNNYTVGLGIRDRELYAFIQNAERRFNRNL